MSGSPPRLSDEQFQKLRDLIYDVSGISYSDNKKYLLESRIGKRLQARNLRTFDEYHYFLRFDPRKQEEFTFLFNEITTNETSFFRNMPQVRAFEKQLLPDVIAEKLNRGLRSLKIWSAGCSSGEEPYTLAICVREALGAEADRWHLEIFASDISTEVLKKGEAGVYQEYTMRATPLALRNKYFTHLPSGEFAVKPELKRMVHFRFLNFSESLKMRAQRGYDVIFCRNVLIYFDLDAKKRFVEHFYDALNPGGYLFVGHSESLHNITRAFKMIHFPQALAYRKE